MFGVNFERTVLFLRAVS